MAHWSQTAQASAAADMRDAPPGEPVAPCGGPVGRAWGSAAEVPADHLFATDLATPEPALWETAVDVPWAGADARGGDGGGVSGGDPAWGTRAEVPEPAVWETGAEVTDGDSEAGREEAREGAAGAAEDDFDIEVSAGSDVADPTADDEPDLVFAAAAAAAPELAFATAGAPAAGSDSGAPIGDAAAGGTAEEAEPELAFAAAAADVGAAADEAEPELAFAAGLEVSEVTRAAEQAAEGGEEEVLDFAASGSSRAGSPGTSAAAEGSENGAEETELEFAVRGRSASGEPGSVNGVESAEADEGELEFAAAGHPDAVSASPRGGAPVDPTAGSRRESVEDEPELEFTCAARSDVSGDDRADEESLVFSTGDGCDVRT